MNVVVIGHMELHPDDVEKAMEASRKVVAATKKEDGCLHYEFARDISQPGVLRISEWWRDDAALMKHLQQPHIADFLVVLGSLRLVGNDAKKYTVSDVGPVVM